MGSQFDLTSVLVLLGNAKEKPTRSRNYQIDANIKPAGEWQPTEKGLPEMILSLKEQILSKPVINCEDIVWSIFGLSAATINSVLLFLIFILNAIYLWDNYVRKKENNN